MNAADVATGDGAAVRSDLDAGRRRFTLASLIAMALTAVPFVWILWSDWGPATPFRQTYYENNYFDLQARGMFPRPLVGAQRKFLASRDSCTMGGRTRTSACFPRSFACRYCWLPAAWMEAHSFVHAPGVAVDRAVCVALALASSVPPSWRLRHGQNRGHCVRSLDGHDHGRHDLDAAGVDSLRLQRGHRVEHMPHGGDHLRPPRGNRATIIPAASSPSGLFILCANFDRATTGWACVVGAGLVAVWFLLGFGGRKTDDGSFPCSLAGLIPLVLACALNYAKFGVPFGVPITDQVWSHVNAYRQKFLVANHNSEVGTEYVPTNVVTYLGLDNLSLSRVFPFVTLPTSPPKALGGVLFDKLYRTASVPASTPLLFLLSIWGLVTAFRPRAVGQVAYPPPSSGRGQCGCCADVVGLHRSEILGDFVPFLVLASAVGLADIFRRLEGRRRGVRVASVTRHCGARVLLALWPTSAWQSSPMKSGPAPKPSTMSAPRRQSAT